VPFGLCNTTFERLMERVLQEILTKIFFVYLDDIIVFNQSFEEMMANLENVFICFCTANLKINSSEMFFI